MKTELERAKIESKTPARLECLLGCLDLCSPVCRREMGKDIYMWVLCILYIICVCVYIRARTFGGMILRVRETFEKIIERDESRGWLLIAS